MSAEAFSRRESEIAKARQSESVKTITGGRTYKPDDIRRDREVYQTRYRERSAPVPTYIPPPSYDSGFSDFFLRMMVWDAILNHHYREHPDYQRYRRELDEKAKTNAELKAQLEGLDRKVQELEASGTERKPNYIPPDMPPTVAINADVLAGKPLAEKESEISWGAIFGIALVVVFGACAFMIILRVRRRIGYA